MENRNGYFGVWHIMRKKVSTNVPRDTRERRVIQQWRASGLGEKSIATYITWVRRFSAHVRNEGVDELARLTLADATIFAKKYVAQNEGRESSHRLAMLLSTHCTLGRVLYGCLASLFLRGVLPLHSLGDRPCCLHMKSIAGATAESPQGP